jgi:hypothetical protein
MPRRDVLAASSEPFRAPRKFPSHRSVLPALRFVLVLTGQPPERNWGSSHVEPSFRVAVPGYRTALRDRRLSFRRTQPPDSELHLTIVVNTACRKVKLRTNNH